ncbi:tetratricopeptide repeat protein [Fischerella thermalis]|uniref:tetratricopeptide repeat protein n=1 Tax=Fischerella thermalis TaxID=372787 RepID=UPI0015E14BAB|nr:tetratricopeptide repeat protein [Fischerella thermalis]
MQVKAKMLNGLAEIHRQQTEYELSLAHHSEVIDILEKRFSDRLLQLALTAQSIGNFSEIKVNFDKAIQLFTEMNAPKQIEKITVYSKYFST